MRVPTFAGVGAIVLLAATMWVSTMAPPAVDAAGILAGESAPALPATAIPEPTRAPDVRGLPRESEVPAGRWSSRDLGPIPPEYLSGYQWPISHARITNAFGIGRPGNEVVDGTSMHDGIDISSFCGARIVAAHDGVVLAAGRHHEAFVGWVGDLSPYRARLDARGWRGTAIAVVIDDGNGYRSIYLHLALATVQPGETVRAGELIGYEGETGKATGCHLHYSLFSPRSASTFRLDPRVAATTRLPARKIERIDPLSVLPPIEDGFITWNWGAGGP